MLAFLCLAVTACGRDLGASTKGWGSVAAANGIVYATTLTGQIYALDDFGTEGVSTRWTSALGNENGFGGAYGSPAVGRYVYVSGIDGFLYAFDGSGGAGAVQVAWRQPQFEAEDMPPVVGGPGLDEAGGIIAVGSEDGGLYAYNALTGESLRWSPFRTDGKVWSTPVLRNGVAYFGSQDGSVYAVSLETGSLVWRYDTGGAVVATPLVHKNLLIVGSFDRQLYALGLNDGQPRWQVEAENWWWATPVSSGRAIYAASMDGNVYAVDDNGVLLWKYDMGAPIVADPVLLERGIVVASREGRVVLLRASASGQQTPQEIASYSIRDGEIKAPLVKSGTIGLGGATEQEVVYVGTDDGKVRRLQVLSGFMPHWCYDTDNNTQCPRN
ncbi:MAG: PQQ-binding-like beta-propeller repeat protein [Chloroflexota bacterium]|nr:PQQ-binding-like beta-propeller repeat protein [Chloroflexota bacterium]MDE2961967.1 PQQ-binding-like beta-propeller repeat protein [Chloroflexota bacterium]